jgi:hypothetical protein
VKTIPGSVGQWRPDKPRPEDSPRLYAARQRLVEANAERSRRAQLEALDRLAAAIEHVTPSPATPRPRPPELAPDELERRRLEQLEDARARRGAVTSEIVRSSSSPWSARPPRGAS